MLCASKQDCPMLFLHETSQKRGGELTTMSRSSMQICFHPSQTVNTHRNCVQTLMFCALSLQEHLSPYPNSEPSLTSTLQHTNMASSCSAWGHSMPGTPPCCLCCCPNGSYVTSLLFSPKHASLFSTGY